ncbi:MAG: HDIG domain-containing protein [Chloroflexi bacterium]|nr:HDIG domain-containing protein [Chloroflexota bacterium]
MIDGQRMTRLPAHVQQLSLRIGEALVRIDPSIELFLVGGVVRDLLLGAVASHDLDFATSATPHQTERALKAAGGKVFNLGEKFGTIGAVFETADVRTIVEITTYRAEAYVSGSRKPSVAFGRNLADDLARRDFTINAIAQDPRSGELVDPFDGQRDLERGLVRAVGDATERFREDPLRLMRAVRFASRLGFEIEPHTARAVVESAAALSAISRERVRDELEKMLLGPAPARGIALVCELGLAEFSLPEVPRLRGTVHEPGAARHKDVFSHTLQVLDRTPPRVAVRWAALLHDIAKPATKRVEGGKVTFHGHDRKGERMARRILADQHQPAELVDRVGRLVGLHLRANAYEGLWTDSAVRRFVLDVGDELIEDLLALSRADVTTGRVERRAAIARSVAELEERIKALRLQEDIARIASPLDGLELMQLFDRGPGAWIQPIKDQLREMVIEGELAAGDKEAAVPIARAVYAELGLGEAGADGAAGRGGQRPSR